MIPINKVSDTHADEWSWIKSFRSHHYFLNEKYDALALVVNEKTNPVETESKHLKLVARNRFVVVQDEWILLPIDEMGENFCQNYWLRVNHTEGIWVACYHQVPMTARYGDFEINFRATCTWESDRALQRVLQNDTKLEENPMRKSVDENH